MLGVLAGLMVLAMQDIPPLAGTLPPMPPPRPARSERDDRPRGRLFISPMGEPFRGPDPVKQWFDGADTDRDGALSLAEFRADADRFFAVLDRGKDGEIDPDDIEHYETVLAPEIRTGGKSGGARAGGRGKGGGRRGGGRRGGGGSSGGGYGSGSGGEGMSFGNGDAANAPKYSDTKRGAARFSFFDYPEPVVVADTNFNRGIDPNEFRAAADDRFAVLDKNHDGRITRGELPRLVVPEDNGMRGRGGFNGRPTNLPPRPGDGEPRE